MGEQPNAELAKVQGRYFRYFSIAFNDFKILQSDFSYRETPNANFYKTLSEAESRKNILLHGGGHL